MAKVLLSLGSNQDAAHNIKSALLALQDTFGHVVLSPVYESEAVGFVGDNFLNMVVEINTTVSVGDLSLTLRAIEDTHGRDRTQPRFSSRTLDIDILTYDDCVGVFEGIELPRDEINKNAFVLRPLADTWPELTHPATGVPYKTLWDQYDQHQQKLWQVELAD